MRGWWPGQSRKGQSRKAQGGGKKLDIRLLLHHLVVVFWL